MPKATKQRFFQNTIAIVYDFDGTLSPQPMQEYTVLPKIGIEPKEFWRRVNEEARSTESDPMLVYMRHIVEMLEREKVHVRRDDFAAAKAMNALTSSEACKPLTNCCAATSFDGVGCW